MHEIFGFILKYLKEDGLTYPIDHVCSMAAMFKLMFVLLFILHLGVYSAGKAVPINGDILVFKILSSASAML
ncbi:Protein of unknown function [Anaplasma phagocytophilum]|uniref:Uncharacterized protein n=1 Tax=Anaplasma phagocytophilum TaxID=948 RepID=A0A098EGL9_ANAPH|nr:Protein of unknown function [Anaplasma phagocytophilum]